jgi:pantoate--beta-alanine ligase
MKVLTAVAAIRAEPRANRLVLVPTMGALHQAHLKLIRVAREHAGVDGEVAVSIFVNPLQFEPGSDFERYPRPEKIDEEFCRNAGVDLLFRPTPAEMYAEDRSVFVDETALSATLEGKSRPGHFRGVCTVVAKLFNILAPHAAVFGEKDFQQLAIIHRMVRDLNFDVEIVAVPTVREDDGLAYSSRNQYLTEAERKQAPTLRAALLEAAELTRAGEISAARIIGAVRERIGQAPLARIDYVDLVDTGNLQSRKTAEPNSLLTLAVFFGKTRLIDNIRLP